MPLINQNIKFSKTIPSRFYYSNKIFEQLKENLFFKNWQLICDITHLSNKGDCFPYDFVEGYIKEPLLLINDNGAIKSMTNVCTHRGNILVEKACNIKKEIICRYHGRTFNTCGKFKFMPKFENVEKDESGKVYVYKLDRCLL